MTELEVGQRREPFIVLTVSTYAGRSCRASVAGHRALAFAVRRVPTTSAVDRSSAEARAPTTWLEALSVVAGCDRDLAQEAAPHGLLRAEAAALGNALDRQPARRQHLRATSTRSHSTARRRQPNEHAVAPRKRSRTHAGARRKRLNGEVVGEVARHPAMQAVQGRIRRLQLQNVAELGLSARPRYTTR
jgi:hypothetical protein